MYLNIIMEVQIDIKLELKELYYVRRVKWLKGC